MWSRKALPTLGRRFGATALPRVRHVCSGKLADGDLKSVRPMFDLKGKSFVVTGGGRGIGYATTRAIAEMGGNVAVLDVNSKPVGDFDQLSSDYGIKSLYIKTDVTSESDLGSAFEQTAIEFGQIDGCVTAAGIAVDKPFLDQSAEEVNRVLKVNVTGTFLTAQCAARHMVQQGTGGSIVMIASVCGSIALPGHRLSAYHASKGGVKMLATALSVELAPHGIRTNSISPGYIETDMTRRLRTEAPHLVEIMQKAPPLQRIGNRNDLTGAMVYLLSDASVYTTGTDVIIDGGIHSGRIEWPS